MTNDRTTLTHVSSLQSLCV